MIYVDAAIHPWRNKLWCHLFSEDIDALHAFAARLGMRREWFQQPPKASWFHYDITAAKRVVALRLGAKEASHVETLVIAKRVMRLPLPPVLERAWLAEMLE